MHAASYDPPQVDMLQRTRLPRGPLACVLLLALVARLLVLASLRSHKGFTWIFSRGLETGFVAHALLSGQGFASPFGGATGPTALISPSYTLLVAAVFRLCGEYTVTSALVILLAQTALGVLTVWLVVQLTVKIASARTAVLAGCFVAIWPTFLWVPTIFWDTALTLCLLPALLLLALRLRAQPSRTLWLALGALTGCAVLINLALVPLALAVLVWSLCLARGHRSEKLYAVLLALLLYAPWRSTTRQSSPAIASLARWATCT